MVYIVHYWNKERETLHFSSFKELGDFYTKRKGDIRKLVRKS